MEIIRWANKEGYTLKLTDDEAKNLSRDLEDPQTTNISVGNLEIVIEG